MRTAYAEFERRLRGAVVSELLPTRQASDLQHGLLDYLATTFALADADVAERSSGVLGRHRGRDLQGSVRAYPAAVRPGADRRRRRCWKGCPTDSPRTVIRPPRSPGCAAPNRATRLASAAHAGHDRHRLGQDRGFLFPILDHVLRVKRDPARAIGGLKALILYPMNALANDQALRLAKLITDTTGGPNPLAGVTAALYTGQKGPKRTKVTPDQPDHRSRRDPAVRLPTSCSPTTRCSTSCCCAATTRNCGGQCRQPAVPRARRVPHLRRRPGHRRGDAAAPPRPGAEEPLVATRVLR